MDVPDDLRPPAGGDAAGPTGQAGASLRPQLGAPDRGCPAHHHPSHRRSLGLGKEVEGGSAPRHLLGHPTLEAEHRGTLCLEWRLGLREIRQDRLDLLQSRHWCIRGLCGGARLAPGLLHRRQAAQLILKLGRPSGKPIQPLGRQVLSPLP